MRLVTAMLAKDEAGRDLREVIGRCLEFSDAILLLDDRSTDETPKIAKDLGCHVQGRSILAEPAWGAEAPARAELWNWGAEVAGDGWLLICDADQILVGDPRPYTQSWDSNTLAIPLFDMWNATEFRADSYWGAYQVARPWMVCPNRVPDGWTAQWNTRGLHVGHLPSNWPMMNPIVAPDLFWKHLAYSTAERRKAKHQQYLSKQDCLSPQELAHAMSIIE